MDLITLFVFGTMGLIILAAAITFISKKQIEKKAILRDISNSVMNFDKIDELKRRNLPLKYFAKLQTAERQTIEAKLHASESIDDLFFLYERAQYLASKSLRKNIEEVLVQTINVRIRNLMTAPAPDPTGQILKELYGFEKALKNITAPDTEKKIYELKKKHIIVSEAMKEGIRRLAETN